MSAALTGACRAASPVRGSGHERSRNRKGKILLDSSARGVFAIAVTPFTERLELDLDSVDGLMDFYLERGVSGITLLGMMGEAPKLTPEESVALVRRAIRRVAGAVPVVVGVSAPGFRSMGALAHSAMSEGAAGVMVAPAPNLRSDEQLLGYFREVAELLGPDVPVVLQDFPLGTGVVMSTPLILRLIGEIQSCVMLKHEDWPGLSKISRIREAEVRSEARRVSILCGNGGLFLPEELERGADGAMTGFAFPEMMVEVCRLHQAGEAERARNVFDAYLPLVRFEQQPGLGLSIRKHILAKRGAIASPAVRKPGSELTAMDIAEIERLWSRQERKLENV